MEADGPLTLTDDDMPALFTDANTTSLNAQSIYLWLVRIDITLVVLAAAVGSIALTAQPAKITVAIVTAVLFGLSIIFSGVLAARRYEKQWYGGRAIAESVKTVAWRYSTRAEPYDCSDVEADKRLTDALKGILADRKHLVVTLNTTPHGKAGRQITQRMRDVRAADTPTRLKTYLAGRVDDQRDWYRGKSSKSGQAEGRWFAAIVAAQALGLVAAIALVRWPDSPVNATGFFAALAAGLTAWMQVRRHQELAQSYAIASQELGLIHESGTYVDSDKKLSVFVGDAENAISREHTLWTARRDA